MATAAEILRSAWSAGLAPDREVGVVEWVERNIVLSSAETNAPGPYRIRRAPYMREILESLSPTCSAQRVVAMKGVQLGFTIAASSWIGYLIAQAPRSILYVLPTVDLAKRASKRKLTPIIEETPVLRDRVRPSRERDSGNTTLLKEFPGGAIIITGANSGAGLRQASAAVIIFDELDAFPHSIAEEGDPVILAERASRTFPRRKHFYISTPTIVGRSRITDLYEQSDRRRYFVPCPLCEHKQVLRWSDTKTGRRGVRWSGEPPALKVWYECEKCGGEIDESRKSWMLEHGEWRAERPELSATFRGFHLSALYSAPGTFSWREAVEQFLSAKTDPEKLRAFVNQVLGEPWEERGDAPPWEDIYRRREHFTRGVVPKFGCVLTAGADVQRDRIEVEIIAWGAGLESWSVDYVTLVGDTATEAPWRELDRLLARAWKHETGVDLRIRALAVDSGFETQTVYNWARRHAPDVVFAVKGSDRLPALVGAPTYVDFTHRGKKAYRAVRLWHVGTGIAKRELYGWLRMKPPLNPDKGEAYPAGFLHFPQYDEEHFKQLTAEHLVAKPKKNGSVAFEWVKKHERNERLDARVYGRAAACILGLDRWSPEDWQRTLSGIGASQQAKPVATAGDRARKRGEGFFGWRSPRTT